jgi:hypothetical protein
MSISKSLRIEILNFWENKWIDKSMEILYDTFTKNDLDNVYSIQELRLDNHNGWYIKLNYKNSNHNDDILMVLEYKFKIHYYDENKFKSYYNEEMSEERYELDRREFMNGNYIEEFEVGKCYGFDYIDFIELFEQLPEGSY